MRINKITKYITTLLLLSCLSLWAAEGDPVYEGLTADSVSVLELKDVTTLDKTTTGTVQNVLVGGDLSGTVGDASESDPIFTAWDKSTGISITESQISDLKVYLQSIAGESVFDLSDIPAAPVSDKILFWNNTLGQLQWIDRGDDMVYPGAGIAVSTGSAWGTSIVDNSSNWNTAYGWGNHALVGYITGISGFDTDDLSEGLLNKYFPGFTSLFADYGFTDNSSNWNTAYGWGDHSLIGYVTGTPWTLEGYLTSESDPVFVASEAYGITSINKTNWTSAYNWGDHSTVGYVTGTPWTLEGYLTSETDPIFTAWDKSTGISITESQVSDLGDYTEDRLKSFPATNLLRDNGRFAGVGLGTGLTVSTFSTTPFFTSYNGSSFASAGKFIHNNTTYGGTQGTLETTVADLLTAMGRTSSLARYGSEFFVMEITAGSGTNASATFPGGTRYLASLSGYQAIIAHNQWVTFTGWVRAVGGPLGIPNVGRVLKIDGVTIPSGNYDIAPEDGWVFVVYSKKDSVGYDNAYPHFYSNSGSKIQVALPAVFNGLVDTYYTAPVISIDDRSYLTSESDPVFTAWDKSTGISITESQISDLGDYTTLEEVKPIVNPKDLSQAVTMTEGTTGGGIQVPHHADISFGSGDFSLRWVGNSEDPSATRYLVSKYTIVSAYFLYLFDGKIRLYLRHDSNNYVYETAAHGIASNQVVDILCAIERGISAKIYLDGKLFETLDISSAGTASLDNTQPLWVSGVNTLRHASTTQHASTFNYAVSAADALRIHESGIPEELKGASQTPLTSGTVEAGKTYVIDTFGTGDDFSNIATVIEGTINTNGCRFVTTGTTPTTWTYGSSLRKVGATLQLEPEGITEEKWFDSSGNEHDASYPATGWSLHRPLIHQAIQADTIKNQGTLAVKSSVDLATAEVTNKTADNISETTTRKWAGQTGADVTDYSDSRIANATTEGDITTIARPGGGALSTVGIPDVGAIVITLPQLWSSTMMRFEVDVYNYLSNTSFTAQVGGYNHATTSAWYNTFAQIIGNIGGNNRVRFGHDGTKAVVVIGDTTSQWRYPKIQVKNFQGGFSNFSIAQWETGWNVSIVNDLSAYTLPINYPNALIKANMGYTDLTGSPSDVITAGTNLSWTGSTLNAVDTNTTYTAATNELTLTGTTFGLANHATARSALGLGTGNSVHFDGIRSDDSVYIGDTSNSYNTLGLTINQGSASDEILSLKSSTVNHSLAITESDTFSFFKKHNSYGGLSVTGIGDSVGMYLSAWGVGSTSDTGDGIVNVYAGNTSGPEVGNTENMVAFKNFGDTKLAIKGDGSIVSQGDVIANNIPSTYEEGTYTPTVTCSTSGGWTLASGYNTLAYTKIGRTIHVQGLIDLNNNSCNGFIRVTLPSTPTNPGNYSGQTQGTLVLAGHGGNISHPVYAQISPSISYFSMSTVATDGSFSALTGVRITNSSFSLYANFTYISD